MGINYEKEKEIAEIKHKFKMEELEFERATNRKFHEMYLERGRIQFAEQKKILRDKIYLEDLKKQNRK